MCSHNAQLLMDGQMMPRSNSIQILLEPIPLSHVVFIAGMKHGWSAREDKMLNQ
ncbi:hypothetical protein T4B_13445, partial [Trichinella pseudospiralis]